MRRPCAETAKRGAAMLKSNNGGNSILNLDILGVRETTSPPPPSKTYTTPGPGLHLRHRLLILSNFLGVIAPRVFRRSSSSPR